MARARRAKKSAASRGGLEDDGHLTHWVGSSPTPKPFFFTLQVCQLNSPCQTSEYLSDFQVNRPDKRLGPKKIRKIERMLHNLNRELHGRWERKVDPSVTVIHEMAGKCKSVPGNKHCKRVWAVEKNLHFYSYHRLHARRLHEWR